MDNTLYIGSTNVDDVFHVGMTFDNRSPYLRWQDYDYRAKLPYVPKKVAFYKVGSLRDEPVHVYILKDKNVVSLHKELGISSDEIFRVLADNPKEYLKNLVEEAIKFNKTGIRPVDKWFKPRPHQAWVNTQILDKFDGSKTVIQPANLCARFGKTLGGLSLFKESGLKVMIVAAHWLSANQSFINTVESKFDITSDITIIKPDYQQYMDAVSKGQRVLIDLSLHTEVDKIDNLLIKELSKISSLIYIDEADFGAWTSSCRETASKFIDSGINLVVVATGTNIDRALIGSKGNIEHPITVSYLDLIEAKRGEGHLFEPGGLCYDDPDTWKSRLKDIPEVSVLSLDAGQLLVDELNQLTEEKIPNMAKIFSKRNTHIQRQIVKTLFCDDEGMGEDIFGLYATKWGSIELPAVMAMIPGCKADVNNLVKVGKSIAPHYNWIALHSDDYTNRIAEDKVLDIIKNGGGEKTVIISCSMGSRSFSVPNIISVINFKDGGSVGTAVQQASRCFTPGCDKEIGLVVNYSFSQERTSTFETDLISSALQLDSTDTEGAIRRVYGLANFLRKDEDGYLIKLTEADFLEYVTSKDNIENMASAVIDMNSLLNDVDLLDMLENVKALTEDKEWKGIIDKARTYIKTERVEGEIDPEKKVIRDLIRKIKSIIQTAGNAYYLSPYSTSFKECLEVISSDSDKNDEYYSLVGIDAGVVLNNIYQHLPETFMNLLITKMDKFDTQDKFKYSSSSHCGFDIDSLFAT